MDVNSEHYLIQKICRAAMRCLLIQLNQHDTLHLKPIGMENKLTSPLSRLNPRVQEILISNAYHFIDFSIDSNVLEKTMQQAEINQSNYELEHSFISQRAPAAMMNDFFGFSTLEYSAWRKRLNLEGVDNHCLRYCDEETEYAICALWDKYRHLPPRECYLTIAEESGEKLNMIAKVIERYKNGE